jgi:hypothetical protein
LSLPNCFSTTGVLLTTLIGMVFVDEADVSLMK